MRDHVHLWNGRRVYQRLSQFPALSTLFRTMRASAARIDLHNQVRSGNLTCELVEGQINHLELPQ